MNIQILLIVSPLLLAFMAMLVKNTRNLFIYTGMTLNILLLFLIQKGIYSIGGFNAPYGINLVLDQYSLIGVLLINSLFFFSILSNHSLIGHHEPVLLTLLAGVNGMILTGDLFNLFVFIEITTLSVYILTTQSKRYLATFNYLILSSVGSGLYLLGVILLYSGFGSLNLATLAASTSGLGIRLMMPLLLIFTGLSVEIKLLPFNGWVKGVFSHANGLTGSLMASIVASAGLLATGRILMTLFEDAFYVQPLLLGVAIVTLIAGEFSAFKSHTIKDILLYSSVAQSGLITMLMLYGLPFPALLLLINNAVAKLAMFSIGDRIAPEDHTSSHYKGIFLQNRLLGIGFSIVSLSLIGLPFFLGFYAKINSLMVLFDIHAILPALVLFVTVIEGAYLIRLNITLWFPGNEGESHSQPVKDATTPPMGMAITIVVVSVFILVAGLKPELMGHSIQGDHMPVQDASEYLIDLKGGY